MKQPIKMTPGDELHLTALMAPFSLNLVTGQDRQHLLGYGRAAFVAGHAQLRASTPEAAEDLIEEIIERISDHAVKAMAHQEARKQGNLEQIESARQAIFQAEDCIKRDLRTLASWTDTASAEAEQAAWHAGLDEGRAQAAPAAVAVPDERAAFEAWAKSEDMSIGSDCDGYIHSNTAAASLAWQARAALAANPAAAPLPLLVRDIARELGITCPEACLALKPLGNFSTNTAVTAEMMAKLRERFPERVPASEVAGARERMTTGRACYFMERFLKEEKLLGPNEQAALHYVIDMLEAAAASVVLPEPVAYSLGLAKYAHSSNIIAANEFTPDAKHADEWENLYTEQQLRDVLATATGLPAQAVLDYPWRDRLLDGRELVRDQQGFAEHPELPLLDEGMKPRAFFAALGVEMKHTMADDDLSMDEYDAMSDAENWSAWMPRPPIGDAWNLVAIFDTEDGPAAWWARAQKESREVAPQAQAEPVAWTVGGEVTNWSRDFSKYKTQHYVRPVFSAPMTEADARDAELLGFLQDQCIDLRCFTTSDGEDVGWRTVQHHMGKPHERVVSEVCSDDPRRAIREAMARIERDPYCTGPLHLEDDAAIAAAKGE